MLLEIRGSPGAVVLGSFELPNVGVGNQTQVLCKGNMCCFSIAEPFLQPLALYINLSDKFYHVWSF